MSFDPYWALTSIVAWILGGIVLSHPYRDRNRGLRDQNAELSTKVMELESRQRRIDPPRVDLDLVQAGWISPKQAGLAQWSRPDQWTPRWEFLMTVVHWELEITMDPRRRYTKTHLVVVGRSRTLCGRRIPYSADPIPSPDGWCTKCYTQAWRAAETWREIRDESDGPPWA
jgi:hypothetical protein